MITGLSAPVAVDQVICLPSGKLGILVAHLESASGAAMSEMTAATGWQPHTVRAALSRLRRRGYRIELEDDDNGKVYRLLAGRG